MSENRCKRCNRILMNPNAEYGWWCARLLGINKSISELKDNFRDFINQKLDQGYRFSADNLYDLESILFDDNFRFLISELNKDKFAGKDKSFEDEEEEIKSIFEIIGAFLIGSAAAEDNEYGRLAEIMLPPKEGKDQGKLLIKLEEDSIIETWLEKLTREDFRDVINTFSEHQTRLKAISVDNNKKPENANAEEFIRLCQLADQKGLIPPEMKDHYTELVRRYYLKPKDGKDKSNWNQDMRAGVRMFAQLVPPTYDPESLFRIF